MVCYYVICPFHETRTSLVDDFIKRGTKKRELIELQKGTFEKKDTPLKKCRSVVGVINLKTT